LVTDTHRHHNRSPRFYTLENAAFIVEKARIHTYHARQ